MKVLIDAHMLGEQEGGNETYIAGLLAGFEALGASADVAVTALLSPTFPAPGTRHVGTARLRGGAPRRMLHGLPAACRATGADLLHVTYNAPPFGACPTVVSVHDVLYRRFPAYFSPRVRLLLNTLLPLSMLRARAVLTLSEASRREIEHFYPFVRERIAVIGLAPGPVAQTPPDETGAAQYLAGSPFVLAVGTVQPRKNIARLIEAYIEVRRRGVEGVRLLIVGRSRWQGSAIQRLAQESPCRDEIVFTGYLSDAIVAALYRRCAAFVYPSLAEGFGLPVLEAMACGAPVITSDRSALPEVAGDAALLVDPTSVPALSAALERVLRDEGLQAQLRANSARRAAQFSWRRVAEETLGVYRQAVRLRRAV